MGTRHGPTRSVPRLRALLERDHFIQNEQPTGQLQRRKLPSTRPRQSANSELAGRLRPTYETLTRQREEIPSDPAGYQEIDLIACAVVLSYAPDIDNVCGSKHDNQAGNFPRRDILCRTAVFAAAKPR